MHAVTKSEISGVTLLNSSLMATMVFANGLETVRSLVTKVSYGIALSRIPVCINALWLTKTNKSNWVIITDESFQILKKENVSI